MSCAKCARLCLPAGIKRLDAVKPLDQLVKFVHTSQPLASLRFINTQARLVFPPLLRIRDQFGNSYPALAHLKRFSKLAEGKESPEEGVSAKLTAKWDWVVRGKYRVAAFGAEDNPAVAVETSDFQYLHRHTCANCKMVYEHDHPYKSLKHPQHIKDCPHCKTFAPLDKEIR